MVTEKELVLDVAKQVRIANNGNNNWKEVAIILGKKYGIVKTPNACKKMYQREPISKPDTVPSNNGNVVIELKPDGSTVSSRLIQIVESDLKDRNMLLKAHGFNPDEFDLISATNNLWQMGDNPSYQSKVTVKPKSYSKTLSYDDIKSFINVLNVPKTPNICKLKEISPDGKEFALEIDWADIHNGSLSWHGDTGYDNDYKITFEAIKSVVEDIIEILNTRKVTKLYHCFLGDFFHIDTADSKTSGGTFVDTDSRPLKMVIKGSEIARYIIENTCFVPSEVVWIPGNHSKMVEFSVFWHLQFIYQDWKHIKFNVSPMARKAIVYGDNLVGLAHGNDIGKDEKDLWLQNEFREDWGKCKYAEVHMGHLHQEQMFSEKGGITKRTNPTLKVKDKYEYDHAWESKRVVMAYLWHETENLKEIFYLK